MLPGPPPPGSHPGRRQVSRPKVKHRPLLERLEDRQLLATTGRLEGVIETFERAALLGPHPLNALKKAPKPTINASIIAGPGADGSVTVSGKTYPKAKVKLDIGGDGSA